MKYVVNNATLQYDAAGEKSFGKEIVLLDSAEDLTAATAWQDIGYSVCPLFEPSLFETFHTNARKLLIESWRKAGLDVTDDFKIEEYHKAVRSQDEHIAAVEKTKLLDTRLFPVDISSLEERISEVLLKKVRAFNPWDQSSVFHFRVIRPNVGDNNPLHRDVWLEDYDNCINLYIPVAGSNELSSLVIYPGSHRWPESIVERTTAGALINNIQFNVPAVTGIKGDPSPNRPSPRLNEVLIFSPYLIHGGSVNLNQNLTRISIEIRLWAK